MSPVLTFVIPVRHPQNAQNWSSLKAKLSQTIASIAAQTNPHWRCLIVANTGADLPALPEKFQALYVDFPPNPNYEPEGVDRETFWESIRYDKGRRVLTGMLAARDSEFFMVVDDDDFIHNEIVSFVARNRDKSGWKIKRGYLWGDGGGLLLAHENFYDICGTCFVIRASHYGLPDTFESADDAYVKAMLGSHKKIDKILAQKGIELEDLPFRGAIYRVGHTESVTKSQKSMVINFGDRSQLRHPVSFLKKISKLRLLTPQIRREFFGNA